MESEQLGPSPHTLLSPSSQPRPPSSAMSPGRAPASAGYTTEGIPPLPPKWITSTKYEDIVQTLDAAHQGPGPAPATRLNPVRLWPPSTSQLSLIVCMAHQDCSTVLWSAGLNPKSGALHCYGHFFDTTTRPAQHRFVERGSGPGEHRLIEHSLDGTWGRYRHPQSPVSVSVPRDLTSRFLKKSHSASDISGHLTVPERFAPRHPRGTPTSLHSKLSSKSSHDASIPGGQTRQNLGVLPSAALSRETARTADRPSRGSHQATAKQGFWRTIEYVQGAEAAAESDPRVARSMHVPSRARPPTATELVDGFRELVTSHQLLQGGVSIHDINESEFRLDQGQVQHVGLLCSGCKGMRWPSKAFRE